MLGSCSRSQETSAAGPSSALGVDPVDAPEPGDEMGARHLQPVKAKILETGVERRRGMPRHETPQSAHGSPSGCSSPSTVTRAPVRGSSRPCGAVKQQRGARVLFQVLGVLGERRDQQQRAGVVVDRDQDQRRIGPGTVAFARQSGRQGRAVRRPNRGGGRSVGGGWLTRWSWRDCDAWQPPGKAPKSRIFLNINDNVAPISCLKAATVRRKVWLWVDCDARGTFHGQHDRPGR